MKRIRLEGAVRACFAFWILVSASWAWGQAAPKDYGPGFEKFLGLGVPDAKGARYVRLDAYSDEGIGEGLQRLSRVKLSGNAWLVKELEGGKALFIADPCRLVEVCDYKGFEKESGKEPGGTAALRRRMGYAMVFGGAPEEEDSRIWGQWKDADARKDAQAILAYLTEESKDRKSQREWELGASRGPLFLSAMHFYRNGLTNEANAIVGALFSQSADRTVVLKHALNTVADAQYADAFARFRRDGNWQAYHDAVAGMVAKFTQGWRMRAAAALLAARLKERISRTPPAIEAEGLDEEDRKLAAELLEARGGMMLIGMMHGGGGPWILTMQDPRVQRALSGAEGKPSAVQKIMARGVRSVPLLVALCADKTLTGMSDNSMFGRMDYDSFEEAEVNAEEVERMYQSMARPLTRGEIAMALLMPIVPGDEDRTYRWDRESVKPEDIGAEARAWYGRIKDKTPVEIARLYLDEGNAQQIMTVVGYLVGKGSEADIAAVEKKLIEASDPMRTYTAALQYAMARGDQARPFIEKYVAMLEGGPKAGDEGDLYKAGSEEWQKGAVKQFKDLLSTQSAREVMADVLAGKAKWSESQQKLSLALAKEEPDAATALLLESAIRVESPEVAWQLINLVNMVPHLKQSRAAMTDPMAALARMEESLNPAKPDLKPHAALWTKLLDDKRPLPGERFGVTGGMIGTVTAWTIEYLYSNEEGQASVGMLSQLGTRGQALIVERARARLAGKAEAELPPLPSAGNVNAEARRKMAADLLAAPPEGLSAAIAKLTMDEHLALLEDIGENEKLNAKLMPVAHTITEVRIDEKFPAAGADLKKLQGSVFDKGALEALFGVCRKLGEGGEAAVCTLTRNPALAGTTISIAKLGAEASSYRSYFRQLGGTARGMIQAQLQGPDIWGSATWPLEKESGKSAAADAGAGKELPPAVAEMVAQMKGKVDAEALASMMENLGEDVQTHDADEQKEFWENAARLCAGEQNICEAARVSFAAILPAKPGEAEAESDEGDGEMLLGPMGAQ